MTYLERQKCYGLDKKILFKKQLFDLEIIGQGPTKVITICNTLPYGHAPIYQISLTYLERQKCYGPDKKILFKKQLFDLEIKGQGPMKVITVRDTLPYGHAPTYQILTCLERKKCYGPDKKILFKKQLFDLEVKGQGPTKVYSTRHTALWSWKILFKKQLCDLEVKDQGPMKVITVQDTSPYGHGKYYLN